MSVSNIELIQHILVETTFIVQHTSGKSKEEVINDGVLCRAVARSIEIIGKASKKLDDEFNSNNN
jgi:uncharacterized protein with HEPN domain